MSLDARSRAIREFQEAGRDGPRVMVLSNVGITGLNLACANIIIVLVSRRICSAEIT